MPTTMLADLCRRVATSLSVGIDERKVWQSEINRATPRFREAIAEVSHRIDQGQPLSQALDSERSPFPPLFHRMATLGNATGRLSEILLRLADQYEHQVRQRREFVASITWPVFQLVAALSIIGLLIWIMGMIGSMTGGKPMDLLGLGLVGTRGLVIYIFILAALFGGGYGLFKLLTSDKVATGPLQQVLLKIPVVGQCLESMLLSHFAWTLGLSLQGGMEIRRALPIAFRSTNSAVFLRHRDTACEFVDRGQTVEEALAATGQFPLEFLAVVAVGETTGQLAESLLHEAEQRQQRAQALLGTIAKIAGFAIWAMIALLIATVVIRIAYEGYIKPLQQML